MRYYQFNNQLSLYPNSTRLCNAINYMLLMNEIQRFIVENVFYSLNKIPNFNCDRIKNQLLLYICSKGRVEKSEFVYAIQLGYTFLLQNSDLVITILMGALANNISDSIIYTSFAISIKNKHRKSNKIFNL